VRAARSRKETLCLATCLVTESGWKAYLQIVHKKDSSGEFKCSFTLPRYFDIWGKQIPLTDVEQDMGRYLSRGTFPDRYGEEMGDGDACWSRQQMGTGASREFRVFIAGIKLSVSLART
jgi:hypothetical protein